MDNDWSKVRRELDKADHFEAICNSPWCADAVYDKFSDAEFFRRHEAARPGHMARMAEMEAAGRIVVSGPRLATDHPDPATAGIAGSVIIAEFESLGAARAWAQDDPYVAAGVWTNLIVQPFHKGFPRS